MIIKELPMLETIISLRFYLQINEKILLEVTRLAEFEEKVKPLEASLSMPFGKIRIGSPIMQIAQCKSAFIEYNGEKTC